MKIIVYVEGNGDRACLETLLRPLIERKKSLGVLISFVPETRGDRKTALLTKRPLVAANILLNDPDASVVLLPDLYPPNKGFPHRTCGELKAGMHARFRSALRSKASEDAQAAARFQVFCLIHDLEVLLLAADEQLMDDRGIDAPAWITPVEKQDHDVPPKRVIERLFARTNQSYQATVDGPRILASADYQTVAARCPSGFGEFVDFLESL